MSKHDWKPTTNTYAAWRCTKCDAAGFSPHQLPVDGCGVLSRDTAPSAGGLPDEAGLRAILDDTIEKLVQGLTSGKPIKANTYERLIAWHKQAAKQLRIKEVDDYADHLSDLDTEAAFEMGWQEYAYKRIREIDAED